MTPTADDVRTLLRTRVRVEVANGDVHERTLAAFTPRDVLLLADEQGFEVGVRRVDVATITDARYTCAECSAVTNTRYDGERCAECYRQWAAKQPAPDEQCDVDGCKQPAVYSPRFKVWRCPQHHAKHGSFTGSTVEMRVLTATKPELADCRAQDVDSDLHEWQKVKSQWVCRKCQVKHFGQKPAGAAY